MVIALRSGGGRLTEFRGVGGCTGISSQIRTKLRDWAGKGRLLLSGSIVLK